MPECSWAGIDELVREYHDHEWGRPVHDDDRLFEMLSLEIFQAGLRWTLILQRRDAFREAFAQFKVAQVARYNEDTIDRLVGDARIIRNRRKITAMVQNARAIVKLHENNVSFDEFVWQHKPPVVNHWQTSDEVPQAPATAKALAHRLKQAGFVFVGPVVCYSFMQAVGIVNDHLVGCPARN